MGCKQTQMEIQMGKTQIYVPVFKRRQVCMGAGGLGRGEGKLKVTKRKYSLTSSFTLLKNIRYKMRYEIRYIHKIRYKIRYQCIYPK